MFFLVNHYELVFFLAKFLSLKKITNLLKDRNYV